MNGRKNTQKTQKNQMAFQNLQSHLTCRYIKMCVLMHSMKVWWRYMLPYANTALFCDMFFRLRAVLPTCPEKRYRKTKNPSRRGSTRIIYLLLVNIPGLYIGWCKQDRGHRRRRQWRQTEFQKIYLNYLKTEKCQCHIKIQNRSEKLLKFNI